MNSHFLVRSIAVSCPKWQVSIIASFIYQSVTSSAINYFTKMANQKNTNVPFGGRSIYSRTLMTNLQQTIKYNRRAFHVTPKKDFLYLVAIGAVVTTGVSYLVFDHLHVKYKNQEVTQKSDKLIFGPHVLFDPKRDNIGIDIGSGYVKMANLLPQIGHSNRLPLSLKSADMNTIFKLRGDAPSDISSEYIIKTAESTICDVQVLVYTHQICNLPYIPLIYLISLPGTGE